jgi:hypothetical protein
MGTWEVEQEGLLLPALCGVSENGIHLMMELTWATSAVEHQNQHHVYRFDCDPNNWLVLL